MKKLLTTFWVIHGLTKSDGDQEIFYRLPNEVVLFLFYSQYSNIFYFEVKIEVMRAFVNFNAL